MHVCTYSNRITIVNSVILGRCSLQSKENQLQDLVDAKSQALAQADRLIAQYRGRKAQTDEEVCMGS